MFSLLILQTACRRLRIFANSEDSDPANQASITATRIKALTSGFIRSDRIDGSTVRHHPRPGLISRSHTTEEEKGPTGPGNAQDTINDLKADGYNVIVNRVGGTPLEQATVVAVRPGQTYSRTDSGNPGDSLATTVTNKTVYVDVK